MQAAIETHPMRHFQGILQIVECIYAAACGETGWDQAVAAVRKIGELESCALSAVDRLDRRRVVLACRGPSAAAEPPAMLGPTLGSPLLAEKVLHSTPGAVWRDRQIMGRTLPIATSTWTEWMQSNGLASWACAIVGRDAHQVVCLEVFAGVGRASSAPGLDGFLRQLAPHLIRAWRLDRASRSWLAAGGAAPSHADTETAAVPELTELSEVVRLRTEFGLTKAEARLALRLAEGASLASAAHAFDVKLTTIRSQLQQVFAKTGTARQTELVALLLSRSHGSRRSPRRSCGSHAGEVAVTG